MQGLSGDCFLLPRPPTCPEVSPPITSRYFGTGPIQVRQFVLNLLNLCRSAFCSCLVMSQLMTMWLVHVFVSTSLLCCCWSHLAGCTACHAAAQIEGGHVAMDGGPPTPPQLHEAEEDAAFGGLFAE